MKKTWLMFALASLALPLGAAAQSSDATLVGLVTDPSGAAVPGATVAAVNTATSLTREVVTNDTGAYRIGPLVPGSADRLGRLELDELLENECHRLAQDVRAVTGADRLKQLGQGRL